ncbi:flagellar basal body-associated FliL family protein [Pseudaminobacter arsenicus]|uniref:Flagellar protein FliL n=1 Tax=Borborobacter arsenicus TaxID=1851146 RepID=A0A432V5V3_9HYPH|nr:flagellar basal body-associated FliL family protein [Pseudaminobacter arsenicus]RUM97542.1 flagellar basal body-associated FliL family protein [Pseudaminobacter arsenicus]
MAITDESPAKPDGPSLVVQIAVLLAITAAAIGLGWLSGQYLNGQAEAQKAALASQTPDGATAEGEHAPAARDTEVLLPPITTNLAAPTTTWVRLEAAIVLDEPQPETTLADDIHQDLLAFLRTVRLHQVEGASGFQHLKADMEERARIRSDGHVKQVLIRTLIFE